jgi:hypothetical protein
MEDKMDLKSILKIMYAFISGRYPGIALLLPFEVIMSVVTAV